MRFSVRLVSLAAISLVTVSTLIANPTRSLAAMDSESLAQQAVDAYGAALDTEQRDLRLEGFRRAERLFARVTEGESRNPELYTNWGNAALQAEHLGAAVLAYRRALALDPDHPRAAQNLEHARTLLPEWVPVPASGGLLDTFFFWHRTLSRWERALGGAIAFAVAGLLAAAGLRFGKPGSTGLRNVAIGPALVWLVLSSSVLIDAEGRSADAAVLVADETLARAADSALAPQTLPAPLPSGVEVEILERRSPWLRVRLANGRDAWVPESAVKAISVSLPDERPDSVPSQ